MDIKSVSVENFRSHVSYTLPLDSKVTILTGPNGSGKSSLLEAASTCLIGSNSWTDRDGVTLKALIKKGEKQARVTVVGKREITRIIGQSGSKLVLDGKDSLTQFELLDNLKVSAEEVKASLVPQAFLTLPIKDQKEVLYALLGKKMTLERIEKYIPEQAKKVWNKLAARWTEDHEDQTYVDLDKFYRFAFEARRDYKSSSLPALKADPDQKDRADRLAEVSQKISIANFDNEKIRAAKVEIAGLPERRKRLAEIKNAMPDSGLEQRLNDAKDEVIDLTRKEGAAQVALQDARKEAERLKAMKFGKGQKVSCPIGLDCPHDETSMKAKITMATGLVVVKEGEMKAFRAKLKDANERWATAEKNIKTLRAAQDDADAFTADIERLEKLKETMTHSKEVDIDALLREKQELTQQLGAAKPKPVEADPTVEHLDMIVQALDVNGIKTELLKKGIGELEDEANAVLKKFGFGPITFFCEKEYAPSILLKGTACSMGELSEGERLNTSLILQDVFARWSDVNLVVLDNIDLLDQVAYEKFVNVAQGLKSKVLIGLANQAHAEKLGARSVNVVILGGTEKKKATK